ncbi:phage tail protein [Streptomyces sp. NPDC057654]|uniref:phage tail tube protein n=1 Tax=Streptomyces sp. NPDC057654 TaxID=3346196 RepID=UPI003689C113
MSGMNPNEIRVAGTGRVLVAKVGTTAPVDAASEWGAGWVDLGYTAPEGVKFGRKGKTVKVNTWQTVGAARYVYDERDLTLKFGMLQLNENTLPFFYGNGNVAETASGSGTYSFGVTDDALIEERALGLEFTDGNEIRYRFIVPRGQVTDTDDMDLNRKGAIKLGVTFTALPQDGTAPLATWIMKDPAFGDKKAPVEDGH